MNLVVAGGCRKRVVIGDVSWLAPKAEKNYPAPLSIELRHKNNRWLRHLIFLRLAKNL
jgi:Tfp pilus assembly protein PilZ